MIVSVMLAGLVLVAVPVSGRRSGPEVDDEAAAYDAIAAELMRGASLRHALAAVYPGTDLSRLALSGQPMSWVAAELMRRSPRNDELVGAGLQLAASSGASATGLFASLAARVRSERQIAARKRVLTTQARASALVVASLPLVFGLMLTLTSNTDAITGSAVARAAVLLGMTMELAGAGLVALISTRAGR